MELTLSNILGKTILVGVTFLDRDENLVSMIQFSGEIIHTDKRKGIAIASQNLKRVVDLIPDTSIKGNGETYILPPNLASLQIAPEGEYRIRPTGEVIVNPDLLSTWTLIAQKKHKD